MTDRESSRQVEQRRIADVVTQVENIKLGARVQTLTIVVTACAFFGGIIVWMASTTTKELIKPYSDEQIKLRSDVDYNRKAIESTQRSVEMLRIETKEGFKDLLQAIKEKK